MATTGLDLITDALRELRILNAVDPPSAQDADFALGRLNQILDLRNAARESVYVETFEDFTLVPSLSPHTIGPDTATFDVDQRPVSIEYVALNLGSDVFTPITLRDRVWWERRSTPALESGIPTDVYYAPNWPNGQLYFYLVPDSAYAVRIWMRVLLASVTLVSDISLPPGYYTELMLSLAEDIAPALGVQFAGRARLIKARQLIHENNTEPVRIATRDFGMPQSGMGTRASFNWKAGWPRT